VPSPAFREVLITKCRYTIMDTQATTNLMSVLLAIVIGYFAGRALGI
jgi:hypothetical protein